MKTYISLLFLTFVLVFHGAAQEDYSWPSTGWDFDWAIDEDEDTAPKPEAPAAEDVFDSTEAGEEPADTEWSYNWDDNWGTDTDVKSGEDPAPGAPALIPVPIPLPAPIPAYTGLARSPHYEVSSDGEYADAEALAKELEGRFEEYNRLFRFNPAGLEGPLKVRAYRDKQAYDDYLNERLKATKPGAVYLHYSDPDKRELIIHQDSAAAAQVFPHQVFIQFLRAFVANPPSWIREGFALYFHTLRFSKEDGDIWKVSYAENIGWLERVKQMGNAIPPVQAILRSDIDGPPVQAELLSWALVSFLMNSGNEDYFRTLVECFMVLSPSSSAASNAEAVIQRIAQWNSLDTVEKDFRAFIASRWTFADLVEDGQKAYDAKNYDKAQQAFLTALDFNAAHYIPHYYLGLLAYENKDYTKAEEYYRLALRYGADLGQTAYAWGVSEVSAGHADRALVFLEIAAKEAPERYSARVNEIRARLRK